MRRKTSAAKSIHMTFTFKRGDFSPLKLNGIILPQLHIERPHHPNRTGKSETWIYVLADRDSPRSIKKKDLQKHNKSNFDLCY